MWKAPLSQESVFLQCFLDIASQPIPSLVMENTSISSSLLDEDEEVFEQVVS